MAPRRMFVTAALVVLAALWGGASAQTELQFYYPVGVSGPLATIINGYVDEFNKSQSDIVVKPVFAGSYTESYSKTIAAIRGGTPPDTAILLSQNLNDLLTQDLIVPLDDFIAKDAAEVNMDDFFPAFMLNSSQDGKVWSIPFQRSTPVMYYNKDAFREAGLDPENPPQTWDDLVTAAQALTTKDAGGRVQRYGLEIPSSGGVDTWLLEALTIEAGGLLYDANDPCCTITLNTQPVKDAIQFLRDLGGKDGVSPEGPVSWSTAPNDFVAGKVAMIYHSTGSLGFIRNNATFDFGTAFLPQKERFGTPTGGGNFYLFKDTPPERQQAAWTFIKWMTSPERLAQWSIDSGYVAPRRSSWDTQAMKDYTAQYPQALTARDQVEYAKAELPVKNIIEVKRAIVDALQTALTSDRSLDDILAPAQSKIDGILQ